jgi:collagenase-like PrtC family protease
MQIVCLDLEGVLVPEIWIAFSERTGIAEFRRTTRDEPDYDKLMRFRLGLLRQHGLKLADIQAVIGGMARWKAPRDFLDDLRSRYQVIILSDTFYEFADPLMAQLGRPTLFCHSWRPTPKASWPTTTAPAEPEVPRGECLQGPELPGHRRRRFVQRHRHAGRSRRGLLHPRAAGHRGAVSAVPENHSYAELRPPSTARPRAWPPERASTPGAMPRAHLELLAPARDAAIGIEAINHGADAVYIGGPAFGARDKAGNPLQEIEALCRHAHRYGARIFVTLNTILRDDELEAARRMAWDVWRGRRRRADRAGHGPAGAGPAADPAARQHADRHPHAAKARFLQDVGFSRWCWRASWTWPDPRHRRRNARRGAGVLRARRAVRGLQRPVFHQPRPHRPQRQPRQLQPGMPAALHGDRRAGPHRGARQVHVLSLKDNDQSANLAALVDAGIRSFKIEGRYKDMATVKNVTAHYRQLLDALLEKRPDLAAASSGRCRHAFTPDPERGFNRGATDYFVNGRQIDIGAFDTPKHAGMPLGEVVRVGKDYFRHQRLATSTGAEQRRRADLVGPAGRTARRARQRGAPEAGRPRLARRAQRPHGHAEGPEARHRHQPQPRHGLGPFAGQSPPQTG